MPTLSLKQITRASRLQPRIEMDRDAIAEYADAYRRKIKMPPVVVFFDGETHWLADGYHRYAGALRARCGAITAEVRKGTDRDALLYSCGANQGHGLRRTNADKRRAVVALLDDADWAKKSDRWIADQCGVSFSFVSTTRRERSTVHDAQSEKDTQPREGRDGKKRRTRRAKEAATTVPATSTKAFITLPEWAKLSFEDRHRLLSQGTETGDKGFNKQTTESIEWAQWSWNPVTGCKHDCPYCYARDIAERFYDQKFVPALLPDRLAAPGVTAVPAQAASDIAYQNVFTCSMADLFGRWVPAEWIEAVLAQVRAHSEWNFLFLTKFPKRYGEFRFPKNAWLGTTVDTQARVDAAEAAFETIGGGVRWLSIEPMLEPLHFAHLDRFQWIVLGGASASNQTPEWRVPAAWWMPLHQQAADLGLKVYHKTNLYDRPREFPGITIPTPKAPGVFDYLRRKSRQEITTGEAA